MTVARVISRAAALSLAVTLACPLASQTALAQPPALRATLGGDVQVMFSPARDACDGHDVPDLNARAFRDASGGVVMYALHYMNRALRGPTLGAMKLDCAIVLRSGFNGDPAAYDDQSWIAATWTQDGRAIDAIVHHEYHGDRYKRCIIAPGQSSLACWHNTLLAAHAPAVGAPFVKAAKPVVASAPFTQDVEQGRHRGFFNPSNIFAAGGYKYFFASTTGWPGQPFGVCLFRTTDTSASGSWRAWDGKNFSIAYADPYRAKPAAQPACKPIAPFPAQVGAVVRHRASGQWLAVVQAWKDDKLFPVSGFYYATSRDLLHWSDPRLLMATRTLYDNPCGAGTINSYPSILDDASTSRNFDDIGDRAWLYWSAMRVDGCSHTSDRRLLRRALSVTSIKGDNTP